MTSDRRPRRNDARLFFAVWPPPAVQQALGDVGRELRGECGGRAVPAERSHLTLAFLGGFPRHRIPALQAAAAKVAAPAFLLEIDHAGYWRRSGIVWAGASRCPVALVQLVEQLGQHLGSEGYEPDPRPYVPHITLLRDAHRAPRTRQIETLAWPVTRFALVESVPLRAGPAYQNVMDWPLER